MNVVGSSVPRASSSSEAAVTSRSLWAHHSLDTEKRKLFSTLFSFGYFSVFST